MFYSQKIYRQELFFDTFVYDQEKNKYRPNGTISFNLANVVSIQTDESKVIETPDGDDLLKVKIITDVEAANFDGIVDRQDYEYYYNLFHNTSN